MTKVSPGHHTNHIILFKWVKKHRKTIKCLLFTAKFCSILVDAFSCAHWCGRNLNDNCTNTADTSRQSSFYLLNLSKWNEEPENRNFDSFVYLRSVGFLKFPCDFAAGKCIIFSTILLQKNLSIDQRFTNFI